MAIDLESQDLVIPLSFIQKKNSYLSSPVRNAMELIQDYYIRLIENNSLINRDYEM